MPQFHATCTLTGSRTLKHAERFDKAQKRLDPARFRGDLYDNAVFAHVDDLRPKLGRERRDGLHMLVLTAQRLRRRQRGRARRVGGVQTVDGLPRMLEGLSKGNFPLMFGVKLGFLFRCHAGLWVVPLFPPGVMGGSAKELFLEVLRPEDGDLYEGELAKNQARLGVVQNSPDRHLE